MSIKSKLVEGEVEIENWTFGKRGFNRIIGKSYLREIASMAQGYIDVQKKGEQYFVSLVGPLDENMSFKDLICPSAREIIVNFEKVNGIKSFGIRELIRWLSKNREAKIIYSRCPKIVVDQINIVDGFLPLNAHVESFYVPYYSDQTEEELQVLFRFGYEFNEASITPPELVKDSAGNSMEMDAIWSKYFRFIENRDRRRKIS